MSFVMLDIVDDRFSMINYKNSSFVIIQDGTSHYMKGIVLFLCYIVIGACFFVHKIPVSKCLAKKLFLLTMHVAKQYNIYVIILIHSSIMSTIFMTGETTVNLGVKQSSGFLNAWADYIVWDLHPKLKIGASVNLFLTLFIRLWSAGKTHSHFNCDQLRDQVLEVLSCGRV